MSATVDYFERVQIRYLKDMETETVEVKDAYALKSYNSIVAIWDERNAMMYLLPRYDYSVTTWKHVHAFIEDYTILRNESANVIRQRATNCNNFAFASEFNYPGWWFAGWQRY